MYYVEVISLSLDDQEANIPHDLYTEKVKMTCKHRKREEKKLLKKLFSKHIKSLTQSRSEEEK